MSEVSTVDLQTRLQEIDASATGFWSESFLRRPETPWILKRIAQVAGMVFVMAASPATAVPDMWFFERRRRDVTTAYWVLEEAVGRPISRVEALSIARQILERAEHERLELAEFEAARGIQWENEE